jgi:hypothetical protein
MKSIIPLLLSMSSMLNMGERLYVPSKNDKWYNQFNSHKSKVRTNKNKRKRK